jgi:hypothetical protein
MLEAILITIIVVFGVAGVVGTIVGLCWPWIEQRRELKERLRQRDLAAKRPAREGRTTR